MSNAETASLERQLKVRCDYESRGRNFPPAFRTTELAKRFNLTPEEIVAMLEALKKPK